MATETERLCAEGEGESPSGERLALIRSLFQEHNRTLVSFLQARLHDEQEARDVAQEAYVRLLQLDNYGAISFLRSYLFRIAENLAVDRLRERRAREAPQAVALFKTLIDECAPERKAMATEELDVVYEAIQKLPPKPRQAFIRHVFSGQSTAEIATALNMTDRMIRNYIAQALALCRVRLDRAISTPQDKKR